MFLSLDKIYLLVLIIRSFVWGIKAAKRLTGKYFFLCVQRATLAQTSNLLI